MERAGAVLPAYHVFVRRVHGSERHRTWQIVDNRHESAGEDRIRAASKDCPDEADSPFHIEPFCLPLAVGRHIMSRVGMGGRAGSLLASHSQARSQPPASSQPGERPFLLPGGWQRRHCTSGPGRKVGPCPVFSQRLRTTSTRLVRRPSRKRVKLRSPKPRDSALIYCYSSPLTSRTADWPTAIKVSPTPGPIPLLAPESHIIHQRRRRTATGPRLTATSRRALRTGHRPWHYDCLRLASSCTASAPNPRDPLLRRHFPRPRPPRPRAPLPPRSTPRLSSLFRPFLPTSQPIRLRPPGLAP